MMYELNLNPVERKQFNNLVYKKMNDLDISTKELAEQTGYAHKSVLKFFSDLSIPNRIMAAKIMDVLAIEYGEWKR